MISLSSDSGSDSEVEIVGSYSNKNDLLPLSSVRVEVNALNISTSVPCIDLTSLQPSLEEQNTSSRHNLVPLEVVDLTIDVDRPIKKKSMLSKECQTDEEVTGPQRQFTKADSQRKSAGHSEQDHKAIKICVRGKSQKALLHTKSSCYRSAYVKLNRLSILKNNPKSLLTLDRSCVNKAQTMSLHNNKDTNGVCPDLPKTVTFKRNKPFPEVSKDTLCQEEDSGSPKDFTLTYCSQAEDHLNHQNSQPSLTQDTDNAPTISSFACAPSSGNAQSTFSKEINCSSPSLPLGTLTVHPSLVASRNHSPVHSIIVPSEDVNSLSQITPNCESFKRIPPSKDLTSDKAPGSCSHTPQSSPLMSTTINQEEEPIIYEDELEAKSSETFSQGQWGVENESFEQRKTFATDSEDDKYEVCPAALKHSGADFLAEKDITRKSQMLCHQSLSLVYSTIDENYQEGTLQLLSDLLQPGFYPPKDITSHLLWGILLNSQSPHHNCVHAFDLLMRTQRYHLVDKLSAPWNWEKLSNVLEKQEHQPEMLCMFLEYVVQTLEDDFKAKQTTAALHQSLAKAVLSFDQFSHIRDVCKWLFSAIVKSTDCSDMEPEHIRIVANFQRMLSLSLEVDRSPAICCAKLSMELFHILISSATLRSQRMMLLESLQNKLLMCKLLEHLLNYSCPVKTSVPMSLSLLLHFLKHCTLSPDPKDGTEKWRRWDELVCLLWMLLLSYSAAMKGYLRDSQTEKRCRFGPSIYKPEDMVSKCAVLEAVEAFRTRSKDDIDEALPLHVVESVTYLRDHLLDVCQS